MFLHDVQVLSTTTEIKVEKDKTKVFRFCVKNNDEEVQHFLNH